MPDNTKPTKIVVGTIGWNNGSQSFDVPFSADFGIATGAENAGFTIETTLTLANGRTLGPVEHPVVKSDTTSTGNVSVALRPHAVPWDRDGGSFNGSVDVTATAQLRDPGGTAVGGAATSTTRGVIVEGGER